MTEKTTLLAPALSAEVADSGQFLADRYDDGTGQALPPVPPEMYPPDSAHLAGELHTTDVAPRCEAVNIMTGQPCNRLLGVLVTRPWIIDCDRHHRNERE